MKISIILPGISGSGGTKVLYEYGKRLSKRGHDVNYYIPIFFYNLHRKNKIKNILRRFDVLMMNIKWKVSGRVNELEKEYGVNVKLVPVISSKFVKDADAVIASAWCTVDDVENLPISKGNKYYFIQGFEVWDNFNLGLESYKKPLEKIVIAQWILNAIEKNGISIQNSHIVRNGIDTTVFKNSEKKYHAKEIRCLMLDHNLKKKGVIYGIKAFELAREKYPNLKLSMFGIKDYHNIPDYVEYYENPSINELVDLYSKSDIFIFPSLEEGWGLTPVEAMACQCAIVGTNVGCMLDIGQDGVNYLMSNPQDYISMANNIVRLVENIDLRKKISLNGLETAKKLDWEKSVDKFEEILEKGEFQ